MMLLLSFLLSCFLLCFEKQMMLLLSFLLLCFLLYFEQRTT